MWALLSFLTSQLMIGIYIGVLIGWLFFKRPDVFGFFWAWLWAQIVYGFGALRAKLGW